MRLDSLELRIFSLSQTLLNTLLMLKMTSFDRNTTLPQGHNSFQNYEEWLSLGGRPVLKGGGVIVCFGVCAVAMRNR